MKIRELQDIIVKLKKEKNFLILAHAYQATEIQEIADYVGDSFGLSQQTARIDKQNVLMCGVRFMAETVKILSPEKHVFLANRSAGCPMAEQMDKEFVLAVKEKYPDHSVAAYINTTADLKTVCDVCVTSSSAVEILRKYPADKFIFIPDCNLGAYVANQIPEKQFQLLQGGCPTHARMTAADVLRAKELHPNALFLVHPECKPEVAKQADFIGSTTGIMAFARSSECKEFIIGTEISIAESLSYEMPEKKFYPLSVNLVCQNMKATTLVDVYRSLNGEGEEIFLANDTMQKARKCIDRMIELGE